MTRHSKRLMREYQVLIDSDAFIGLMVEQDAHHLQARSIFNHMMQQRKTMVTTNYVITEAASTLSRRFSMALAKQFLVLAEDVLMISISTELHQDTSRLFRQQGRQKTSFVDMANVVVMKAFDIPQIFSFDKVYARDFRLNIATADAA